MNRSKRLKSIQLSLTDRVFGFLFHGFYIFAQGRHIFSNGGEKVSPGPEILVSKIFLCREKVIALWMARSPFITPITCATEYLGE